MKKRVLNFSYVLLFLLLASIACTKQYQTAKLPEVLLQNVPERVNDWLEKQKLKFTTTQSKLNPVQTNNILGGKKKVK